ncbi:MAG: sigma-70 family RNA polymerase sigma factor [Pseudonocardiales bacterium]|nr:sigma-70 family RNA polymerase sigma factor [Pseudonocardiales bacterium]
MPDRPAVLVRLLESRTPRDQDEAWADLVQAHTTILLRTARFFGGDHDAVMDRYAFILDHLQRNSHARLRGYTPRERGSFEVWLVAVARRLCLDQYRQKYGRVAEQQRADDEAGSQRRRRRRQVDLIGEAVEVTTIPDTAGASPDKELAARDLRLALTAELDGLEPRDRLLLRLLFEEELTARETARLMRFPTLFHVYRRRNSVLALLRQRLRARGIMDGDP